MSGTGETTIAVTGLHAVGRGVDRPEQVVVAGDGRVFASDKASAVAELIDENTVRRMGQAGGEPNGIAIDPGRSEELAARLRQFADDPALVETMGRNGEAVVRDTFAYDKFVAHQRELLSRAMAGQR